MATYDYDIGIIGGGAAGLTVAAGAAQLGLSTLLVEREPNLGGDCLHHGCVPSKTLIRTASVYHAMRNAGQYGLPEAAVPPVDFRTVARHIRGVIGSIQAHDSEERFCGLGARVLFGEAEFEDEHVVRCDGKRISARFWVLATGSSPAIPSFSGLDGVDCLTNRNLFDLKELPASMLILGGGPVGCEMAQAFQRLGCQIAVVQRGPRILKNDDADMVRVVMDAMKREGVRFELNATPRSVRKRNGRYELECERDGETFVLNADALLVATGRTPNVAGLRLKNAGVECGPRGIVVDERLRTSQKHIFAAGDVLGKYLFTHAAGYEGGIVISNAVFRLPRKVDYTWMPWCTYTEPELASIGMNEERASRAGVEHVVWEEPFSANDRALAEGQSEGRIKLVLDRREKPLGVQIAGPHAGEVMGEWISALNAGTGLSTLASAVHPYPTVCEINKRVAGRVLASKLFSDKVKKALGFLFDYKGRACTLD
ncbi:dihydrolipoyl dehydrogenase family protein [Pseudodesulfovibrio tunisiensis]|uniref:dihydrolipoyl dehydrogenase family protein n=1 Tax=Pseudodesulfovibrio tunisiensis TaxID=463192 RepID=UPI001FB36465|nr:FAD-dependent oxidoreductase [Pseudodesulfovibrio tunisiensis]